MNDTGKGIMVASVVLGASIIISTVLVLGAAARVKDEAIYYAGKQKAQFMDLLRAQKRELRMFEKNRELRLRNFIREEILSKANATIEMKAVK